MEPPSWASSLRHSHLHARHSSWSGEGLVPETISDARLQQANALLKVSEGTANVVGPAVAGVLVAAFEPGVAYAVDALTFAVSALFLVRLRLKPREPAPRQRFFADLLDGAREAWSHVWLRAGFLAAEAGRRAGAMLLDMIQPEDPDASAGSEAQTLVPTELLVRQSTAPAPRARTTSTWSRASADGAPTPWVTAPVTSISRIWSADSSPFGVPLAVMASRSGSRSMTPLRLPLVPSIQPRWSKRRPISARRSATSERVIAMTGNIAMSDPTPVLSEARCVSSQGSHDLR